MAGPYAITTPVQGQPIPSAGFGLAVKNAINDLDARTGVLETGQQVVVKRGRRTTQTSASTGSEISFLRLDNIPVRAGTVLQINTSNMNIDTTVNNDIATVRCRLAYSATTGTVATTASTQIGQLRTTIDDATQSNVLAINMFHVPPADGYISLLLTLQRITGTGSVVVFCSATEILDFVVQYGGTDPGDTGVIL